MRLRENVGMSKSTPLRSFDGVFSKSPRSSSSKIICSFVCFFASDSDFGGGVNSTGLGAGACAVSSTRVVCCVFSSIEAASSSSTDGWGISAVCVSANSLSAVGSFISEMGSGVCVAFERLCESGCMQAGCVGCWFSFMAVCGGVVSLVVFAVCCAGTGSASGSAAAARIFMSCEFFSAQTEK